MLSVCFLQAQSSESDSLQKVLKTAAKDTNAVELYIAIGDACLSEGNIEAAKANYEKAKQLSQNLKWLKGELIASVGIADILNYQGMYDSIFKMWQHYIPIAEQNGDFYCRWLCYGNLGISYDNKGYFELALQQFYNVFSLLDKEKNAPKRYYAQNYYMLQLVYSHLERWDKALENGELALQYIDTQSYKYLSILVDMATVCLSVQPPQYDRAEQLFQKAIQSGDAFLSSMSYDGLGMIYTEKKEYQKAEECLQTALSMYSDMEFSFGIASATRNLSMLAFKQKQFDKSEKYAYQSLQIAQRDTIHTDMFAAMEILADLALIKNDFESAEKWRNDADSIRNIVNNDKLLKASEELSVKYETEKKEAQIASMQKERKFIIGLTLAIGLTLLLSVVVLALRHRIINQRKKLAEQKVKQLEQEKQLVATQAVLDGETAERTRLARDLHDGLGGMLSVVKLNLSNMKGGAYIEQADVQAFDKALKMLDNSISELRRVAHHLMPDSLSRYGLKTALSDFCAAIPIAEFHYYGNEKRLEQKVEVTVYRVIYELVNNALKHAHAAHIIVQLMQEPDRIAFTVQDDGDGFDLQKVAHGMGLLNIKERIAAYNGNIDFDSKHGEGTEVSVMLQV